MQLDVLEEIAFLLQVPDEARESVSVKHDWKENKHTIQEIINWHTLGVFFLEPARPFGFAISTAFSDNTNRESS
jgi:hypothetical protein